VILFTCANIICNLCSSGELAAEFENRRKEMLQLESEVQQKMEKRKVCAHKDG
jgi:hypothetical protein